MIEVLLILIFLYVIMPLLIAKPVARLIWEKSSDDELNDEFGTSDFSSFWNSVRKESFIWLWVCGFMAMVVATMLLGFLYGIFWIITTLLF